MSSPTLFAHGGADATEFGPVRCWPNCTTGDHDDRRDLPDPTPETFADLPLQPTGSGVADLEIAFEQMKLVEGEDVELPPTGLGEDGAESEAHPS